MVPYSRHGAPHQRAWVHSHNPKHTVWFQISVIFCENHLQTVALAVLGEGLDSRISEGFSKLDDSVTP